MADCGWRICRREDGVRVTLAHLSKKGGRVRNQISLVEHVYHPFALGTSIAALPSAVRVPQFIVDHFDLLLPVGGPCIDDMQEEIGIARLLERCPERGDQVMGEL